MKKLIGIGLFIFFHLFCYSQNLDLIVTVDGDSVACKILEVNDSEIIFTIKALGHKNVRTVLERGKIAEYKYDVIQKDRYIFKPGTSYIVGKVYQVPPSMSSPINSRTYSLAHLQNASGEELEYLLYKARKLQKSGKTLNITGASVFGASVFVLLGFGGNMGMEGILFGYSGLVGIGTMAVGIPMNLTGKSRVEKINSVKNTAFNDIKINIQPCAQYNMAIQNYQPGITLKIRF